MAFHAFQRGELNSLLLLEILHLLRVAVKVASGDRQVIQEALPIVLCSGFSEECVALFFCLELRVA